MAFLKYALGRWCAPTTRLLDKGKTSTKAQNNLLGVSIVTSALLQFGWGALHGQVFAGFYNAGDGTSTIGEYTASGLVISDPLISRLDVPTALALDGFGHIFVAEGFSGGTIGEYTTSGVEVNATLISGLTNPPVSIAADGNGNLFLLNDLGVLSKYRTSGETVNASLISGLPGNPGLALDGNGNLFVATSNTTVGEFTTEGALVNSSLISLADRVWDIACDKNGHLFVAHGNYGSSVGEYTTSGATVDPLLIVGLPWPSRIALDGNGLLFGVGASAPGALNGLFVMAFSTSSGRVVSRSLIGPGSLYSIAAVLAPTPIVKGPTLTLGKAVKPSFSGLSVGTNYLLQASADLNAWVNQGAVFTATNASITFPQYFDVDNFNQLFFRLQVAP
jgi:hypothetical protein